VLGLIWGSWRGVGIVTLQTHPNCNARHGTEVLCCTGQLHIALMCLAKNSKKFNNQQGLMLTNMCSSGLVSSGQPELHCIDKSWPVKLARSVNCRCSMAVDGAIVLYVMATKCIGSMIACAIRSHNFFGRKVRVPTILLWLQKSDQITVMHKLNCAQITVFVSNGTYNLVRTHKNLTYIHQYVYIVMHMSYT
jgi:hypothetical protein